MLRMIAGNAQQGFPRKTTDPFEFSTNQQTRIYCYNHKNWLCGEMQSKVQSLIKKIVFLEYFNQPRKSHLIETEVYYQPFIAPFSECFNQTFLDIRNRSHGAKYGR